LKKIGLLFIIIKLRDCNQNCNSDNYIIKMSYPRHIRSSELRVLMAAAELTLVRGFEKLELEKVANSDSSDPSIPSNFTIFFNPTIETGTVDDINIRYTV
jgi:hypothetical protein